MPFGVPSTELLGPLQQGFSESPAFGLPIVHSPLSALCREDPAAGASIMRQLIALRREELDHAENIACLGVMQAQSGQLASAACAWLQHRPHEETSFRAGIRTVSERTEGGFFGNTTYQRVETSMWIQIG